MQAYFDQLDRARFEGPKTENPLAFRHYNPDELVLGKRMEDHLRFAACYWHTFCWNGADMFGIGSFDRPWQQPGEAIERAKRKADVAFEFFHKLNVPYYCFHDIDVSPEGANLKADVLGKLDVLEQFRLRIAEHAPSVPVRLREAMLKRLADADLSVSADDERIIREVALFADKCDISEEITRLSSHFDQFRTLCGSSAPAGRPLDFLCQEIFREFNTIGSKANDSTLAHLVVAAKTELEKIREQVQNIE